MSKSESLLSPDFGKLQGGLVPVIVQHHLTKQVLMLGFMNEEALRLTERTQKVTFFSRGKQRLWTKGETSGHYLHVKSITLDCDKDTLLVQAQPQGPTCHEGQNSCFGDEKVVAAPDKHFFSVLEGIIRQRKQHPENYPSSYVAQLFKDRPTRVAQKVGEEAIELVIEACRHPTNSSLLLGECADLLFHVLVLLQQKTLSLDDVVQVLRKRHEKP